MKFRHPSPDNVKKHKEMEEDGFVQLSNTKHLRDEIETKMKGNIFVNLHQEFYLKCRQQIHSTAAAIFLLDQRMQQ